SPAAFVKNVRGLGVAGVAARIVVDRVFGQVINGIERAAAATATHAAMCLPEDLCIQSECGIAFRALCIHAAPSAFAARQSGPVVVEFRWLQVDPRGEGSANIVDLM